MPKAIDNDTPIPPTGADEPEEWPIGDIEPLILNLETTIGIFHHVINSPSQVEANEWGKIEDDLTTTTARIKTFWLAAFKQRNAEERAHEAAIAALEAKKAAPGSPEDIRAAEVMWTMLRARSHDPQEGDQIRPDKLETVMKSPSLY